MQAQTTPKVILIAQNPSKDYYLQELRSDIQNFRNIQHYLDYLKSQNELLIQMIDDAKENEKAIDNVVEGIDFMIDSARVYLEGHIDRTLCSLDDCVRGKRTWED